MTAWRTGQSVTIRVGAVVTSARELRGVKNYVAVYWQNQSGFEMVPP